MLQDSCYGCGKLIDFGQWFCDEKCKDLYWGDTKKSAPKTADQMVERLKQMKQNYLNKKAMEQTENILTPEQQMEILNQ